MSALKLEEEEVDSIFSYVNGLRGAAFEDSVRQAYEKSSDKSNIVFRVLLSALTLLCCRKKSKRIKYFFIGTKFSEIIEGLPADQVCIIGGPREALYCLRKGVAFASNVDIWRILKEGVVSKKENLKHTRFINALVKSVDPLAQMFTRLSKPDAVLVTVNDSLPAERIVLLAGKKTTGLTTICIQHGYFQRKTDPRVMDGWFADYFFAMSAQQAEVAVEKGMHPDKVVVMGFYKSPYQPEREYGSRAKEICFLGQPWIKYGQDKHDAYFSIYKEVAAVVSERGYSIAYKPHPWERGQSYLKEVEKIDYRSLEACIESYDVFISLTSTALFEVSESGRLAIQIVDGRFEADDYGCFSEVLSVNHGSDDFFGQLLRFLNEQVSFRVTSNVAIVNFYNCINKISDTQKHIGY